MNIFGELEGLSGEQLATAGLRLLVLRSPACREAFVRLLDSRSPYGRLISSSHFSCYTEYATADEALGRGRIDLTVELDEVVVGIEVKLAAAFQLSQPSKYTEELIRVASLLSEIRNRTVRQFLVVLAPENRRDEISPHLQGDQQFLPWEEVLISLAGASGGDPFVAVLIEEFDRFLRDHLDFLPRFQDWEHHLTSHWEPRGTEYQRDLLRKLSGILPNAGGRMGSGQTWVGYYFAPDAGGRRSWLGFVPRSRVESGQAGACLLVAGPHDVEQTDVVRRLDLIEPVWVDDSIVPAWEVLFTKDWESPSGWTEALASFLRSSATVG